MQRIAVFVLICMIVAGCSKPDKKRSVPVVERIEFKLGTNYYYAWSVQGFDENGKQPNELIDTFRVFVADIDAMVVDHHNLIMLEAESVVEPMRPTRYWYTTTDAGISEVAFLNTFSVPEIAPKNLPNGHPDIPSFFESRLHFAGSGMSEITEVYLNAYVWDVPRNIYDYPLFIGKEWVAYEYPTLTTRRVNGTQRLKVPAGTFNVTEIETIRPNMGALQYWKDMVSDVGLIKRDIEYLYKIIGMDGKFTGKTVRVEVKLELIGMEEG